MAKKKNRFKPEKVIEQNQETNSGLYVNAGEITHSDNDSKDWTELQADYTKMRNSDALLSTTIDVLKYPILMSKHRIETPNEDVRKYVEWVFDGLYKGLQYFKYHKLLALDFGLQMHEMVIMRGDRYEGKLTNRPIWMNPIQNETINKFHYSENLQFTGIEHERKTPDKGSTLVEIPAENLHWFTMGEEFNDIRGRSLYRPVRMFWESKHKLILSKVTGAQRAVGLPVLYTKGTPTAADKTNIAAIGRTIASMQREGYVSMDEEKMRLVLESPKGQEDIIPMLDYLDRQIFFNTMSQFMTAGIGQNGSRAATEELKSPYEMYASYILTEFEINMQTFVDRIVEMSCFANIKDEEWPMYKQDSIKSTDLSKAAGYIKQIVEAQVITVTPEDEAFIRSLFGFPERKVEVVQNTTPESVQNDAQLSKTPTRKLSKENQEFEDRIFSFESANDHFLTITDKTSAVLEDISKKYFTDVLSQLKNNRKKEIRIRQEVIDYAMEKLTEIYSEGYNKGSRDVEKEISKLKSKTSLATKKPVSQKKSLFIEKKLKRFFYNAKTVVESKMERVTDEFIEKAGGLDKMLLGYSAGFKMEKNNISKTIEESYTDGRGDTLLEFSNEIELFFYSAKLDKALCDSCAPTDGLILTEDEVRAEGLNFNAPVNPACEGGDNCRCQIIPYSLKEGF